MLLLRLFFGSDFVSVIDDIVAILPKVIFSFPMLISGEGRCAIDLRVPGRVCAALGDCGVAIVNWQQPAMFAKFEFVQLYKGLIRISWLQL